MTKVKHLWQYNLHQDEAQKKKKIQKGITQHRLLELTPSKTPTLHIQIAS
jgi:hypothetical protein